MYERRGVLEYWLVHPVGRVLTVYHLKDGKFGIPGIFELQGETGVSVLPEVTIQWDDLAARLPTDY